MSEKWVRKEREREEKGEKIVRSNMDLIQQNK